MELHIGYFGHTFFHLQSEVLNLGHVQFSEFIWIYKDKCMYYGEDWMFERCKYSLWKCLLCKLDWVSICRFFQQCTWLIFVFLLCCNVFLPNFPKSSVSFPSVLRHKSKLNLRSESVRVMSRTTLKGLRDKWSSAI